VHAGAVEGMKDDVAREEAISQARAERFADGVEDVERELAELKARQKPNAGRTVTFCSRATPSLSSAVL